MSNKIQDKTTETTKDGQGGYMRCLHSVEEKLYSPESPLDNFTKVLLYIRHQTVRWDTIEKSFSYSDLCETTGTEKRQIYRIIAKLEKTKLIRVLRRTEGKKKLTNIIGLNPSYFGDFIERNSKPNMSVIQGGKLSTAVTNRPVQVLTDRPEGYCHTDQNEQGQDPLLEPLPELLKNPLKEQKKELLRGGFDFFDFKAGEREMGPEDINREKERQVRAYLDEQKRMKESGI